MANFGPVTAEIGSSHILVRFVVDLLRICCGFTVSVLCSFLYNESMTNRTRGVPVLPSKTRHRSPGTGKISTFIHFLCIESNTDGKSAKTVPRRDYVVQNGKVFCSKRIPYGMITEVAITDLKRMLLLSDGSKLMRSMAMLIALALVNALKSSYEPFHGAKNPILKCSGFCS